MIDFVLILISYHALFVMKNTLLSDGFERHEKGGGLLIYPSEYTRYTRGHFSFSTHIIFIFPPFADFDSDAVSCVY